MSDYDNGDGTINFRGQSGIMVANDRNHCLNVINPQYALLNDISPDQNGKYDPQTWQTIKSLDPALQQNYKSNCYGWVLTGGLYFIDASTKEIADFLTADGYANIYEDKTGFDYNSKVGFMIGGLVQIPVNKKIFIQPELVYSMQGSNATIPEEETKLNMKMSYLNIPVMFKYNVYNILFVEAGSQIGFLLSSKITADYQNEGVIFDDGFTLNDKEFKNSIDFQYWCWILI